MKKADLHHWKSAFFLLFSERETGIEPATPTLARLYSTTEPLALIL